MLRQVPLILIVALFSDSVAPAQQQSPADKSDPPASTGTISGRVVNESGQPLPGAVVRIYAVNSIGQARIATADLEGNFQLKDLDPATYRLFPALPAYVASPGQTDAIEYYRVGDSVRLEMLKGGVVTGTVTNANGDPIVSIRVRALLIRDAKGEKRKSPAPILREQATDDRGIYRIYGLTPGTYLIFAGGGGDQPYAVNAYDTDAPTFAPSSTRDTAAETTVRTGEETTVDIRYRGDPGYVISGTVKTHGSMGIVLTLLPAGNSLGQSANTFMQPGARGFGLSGIADGEYFLTARENASALNADTFMSEPRRISVHGADVTGLELETRALASITGRVLLEPAKAPECQGKRQPLFAETIVTLQPNDKAADKEIEGASLGAPSSSIDKDGAVIFRNLNPAQYGFVPRFFAHYWFVQSITLPGPAGKTANAPARLDAARNWTSVKWGDRLTGLTITLAEGAGSLRGRVSADEGAKLPPGLVLYLVPAEREKADDPLRFFSAGVNNDGTFTVNNVGPGHYWALTQPDTEPANMMKLRLPYSADTRSKLRQKAELGKKEIVFKPCQNVADYQLQYR